MRLLTSLLTLAFTSSLWAASHAYKVTGGCADGLTVTFTPAKKAIVAQASSSPLEICIGYKKPTYPGDENCYYSTVGEIISIQLKLGTYTFEKDGFVLAQHPFSIWIESKQFNDQVWQQNFKVRSGFVSYGINETWVSYRNENLADSAFKNLIPESTLEFQDNFKKLDEAFLDNLFKTVFVSDVLKLDGCQPDLEAVKTQTSDF